jgi:hypothetical protein
MVAHALSKSVGEEVHVLIILLSVRSPLEKLDREAVAVQQLSFVFLGNLSVSHRKLHKIKLAQLAVYKPIYRGRKSALPGGETRCLGETPPGLRATFFHPGWDAPRCR